MKKGISEGKILETLTGKSTLKQQIFDNTSAAFKLLKEELYLITDELNKKLVNVDPRIMLQFQDHGEFNAELKVAGDLLFFNMHSNIFQFDRDHEIWKTDYIKDDPLAGYSGIINMYNFLADSFKYNRTEDLGYLVARIFINKNNHFFVQGKRQSGFNYTTMGANVIDQKSIKEIVGASVQYCLDFDLLVPPYDAVKLVSVAQINQNISDAKLTTGKRLGFQFKSDDVDR
ncbi:MAG: hypothetical protein PHY99_11010 [Bacteroidales bacterium]|nr:hypothetical protein [Bacteroidales bacterium]